MWTKIKPFIFEDLAVQAQEAMIDLIVSIIKNKKNAEQKEE